MKKLYQLLKTNASATAQPNIQAKTSESEVTLYLYDVIDADWGISALQIAKTLATLDPKTVLNLRVNSPGGDVFEARAIATALKAHEGRVVAHIDGLAASAATTIVSAADEVIIAPGSFFMIHNAWTLAMGDKNDFIETAALLEKVDGAISADYVARTGLSLEEVTKMMDAETWLTAEEAVAMKFADKLAAEAKPKDATSKQWNLSAFDNAPIAAMTTPAGAEEFAAQRARNERRLKLLMVE